MSSKYNNTYVMVLYVYDILSIRSKGCTELVKSGHDKIIARREKEVKGIPQGQFRHRGRVDVCERLFLETRHFGENGKTYHLWESKNIVFGKRRILFFCIY